MTKTYERLWMDFESFSRVNLKTDGGKKYAESDTTMPICLGFALDDEPVQVWTPNMTMPQRVLDAVSEGILVYAHNALFDYRIWNTILSRDFNWPLLKLDQMVDTMGLVASYSLPLSLSEAGEAMGIEQKKHKYGTALIKKLCSPNKKDEQPMPFMPEYAEDFKKFYEYCRQDVAAMRELIESLPRDIMIPNESRIWRLTVRMNEVGLPVATNEAIAIRDYLLEHVTEAMKEVPILSGGMFNTINQIAKMKDWCGIQGYPIENTQAATITECLADSDCPDKVKKMLKLRQDLGGTATAKFKKLIPLAKPGILGSDWVHDNLVYHGAGPGRWTGRGFQMHNLPRASVKNPEEMIQAFIDGEYIIDPVSVGKALVRPIIKAPEHYMLMVSDYSSIENRILAWLADDLVTLEDFRIGVNQYVTMAAARYGLPYAEIQAGYEADDKIYCGMRQMGKVIILGCGFGMGADTFVETAKAQFNMVVTEHEAKEAIRAYREKYYLIKKLWNELKLAATRAVITGQKQSYGRITFGTATVKGVRWLAMLLPSGKCIYYKNPQIEQKYVPKYERMGKVPTITHEGRNPYTRKWSRMALIPGRITENAVQGTAREAMGCGMLNVQDRTPEVIQIGTVHDESLSLIHEDIANEKTMEQFNTNLCDIPWADGCPLKAKGYISKRYRK
jgi:DNA polymerase